MLKFLKDIDKVNGKVFPPAFVTVNQDQHAITFVVQEGPIKEFGLNGCQVDDMILVITAMLTEANVAFPSSHNAQAIMGLKMALKALDDRRKEREARGVEGESKL